MNVMETRPGSMIMVFVTRFRPPKLYCQIHLPSLVREYVPHCSSAQQVSNMTFPSEKLSTSDGSCGKMEYEATKPDGSRRRTNKATPTPRIRSGVSQRIRLA